MSCRSVCAPADILKGASHVRGRNMVPLPDPLTQTGALDYRLCTGARFTLLLAAPATATGAPGVVADLAPIRSAIV